MTAAILCPGTSLARLARQPEADLVIGVNRAVRTYLCHVWAACDYPLIRDNFRFVIGKPRVLTRRTTWESIGKKCRMKLACFTEDVRFDCPINWHTKTMTCAMAYAAFVGVDKIELYGCDLFGEADYDGVKAGEDRSDKRWAQERSDLGVMMETLWSRGIATHRIHATDLH